MKWNPHLFDLTPQLGRRREAAQTEHRLSNAPPEGRDGRQARLADSSGPLALSRGHRGKADKPLLQPSGHRIPKRDRKAEALMSRVPGV